MNTDSFIICNKNEDIAVDVEKKIDLWSYEVDRQLFTGKNKTVI